MWRKDASVVKATASQGCFFTPPLLTLHYRVSLIWTAKHRWRCREVGNQRWRKLSYWQWLYNNATWQQGPPLLTNSVCEHASGFNSTATLSLDRVRLTGSVLRSIPRRRDAHPLYTVAFFCLRPGGSDFNFFPPFEWVRRWLWSNGFKCSRRFI